MPGPTQGAEEEEALPGTRAARLGFCPKGCPGAGRTAARMLAWSRDIGPSAFT